MLKEPNFKQDADVRPLQKFELKFLRHLPHGTLPIFCFRKGNKVVSAVGGLLFSALLVEATDDSPLVVRLHLVQRTADTSVDNLLGIFGLRRLPLPNLIDPLACVRHRLWSITFPEDSK
jgi:hypothetical protein